MRRASSHPNTPDPARCVLIESMAENRHTQIKNRWRPTAALLLLCFLLAVGAMRSDLFPASAHATPQMERDALPFALVAVVAGAYAAVRRASWPRGKQLWPPILMGLALFVAPSVLVHFALGWVAAFTRVVLFSLVPVFAVALEPHFGRGGGSQSRGGLVAALLSVVGMLCVFPVEVPSSIEAGFAFAMVIVAAGCVAAANCYAVGLACDSLPGGIAPMAAIASAAAAIGLAGASTAMEGFSLRIGANTQDLAWSAIITLPGLLLLFWLMQRITAVRMTTRFLLAPVIAILIGMAIERPTVAPRIWLGLVLAAGGAVWLLFGADERSTADSSSLNLNRE